MAFKYSLNEVICTYRRCVPAVTIILVGLWLYVINGVFLPGIEQSVDVDSSYRMVLNSQYDYGLLFGRDIVYTFGPLAFLLISDLHPTLTPIRLVIQSVVLAMILLVIYRQFTAQRAGTKTHAGVLLVGLSLYAGLTGLSAILLLYCVPAIVFAVRWLQSDSLDVFDRRLLVLLLVVASLTKFSYFLLGFGVVFITCTLEVWRTHRIPKLLLEYLLLLLICWVASGQSLLAFPLYVIDSWSIASQYGKDQSLWGGRVEFIQLGIYLFCALSLAAASAWIMLKRGRLIALTTVALYFFIILIAMKAGFTRYSSSHVVQSFSILSLLAIFTIVFLIGLSDSRLKTCALLIASIGCLLALPWIATSSGHSDFEQRLINYPSEARQRIEAISELLQTSSSLTDRYNQQLSEVRRRYPLPPISGTVDVYPDQVGLVVAHRLAYNPRPAFQSLVATSFSLLKRNVSHLTGLRPPSVVILGAESVDNRLPALADSLSWPELFSRYEWRDQAQGYAILQRRDEQLHSSLIPISEAVGNIGQDILLPDQSRDALWAEIELRPTLLGRIFGLILALPELRISVNTETDRYDYRFLSESARYGFLLSPLINSGQEFGLFPTNLGSQLLKPKQVRSISISGPGSSLAWYDQFAIRWYRLDIEHRGDVPPGVRRHLDDITIRILQNAKGNFRMLSSSDGNKRTKIRITPPFSSTVQLPDGCKVFSFFVEVESDAWEKEVPMGMMPSDGIIIRIDNKHDAALNSVEKVIDPHSAAKDRGAVKIVVSLKSNKNIDLSLLPRENGSFDNTNLFAFECD